MLSLALILGILCSADIHTSGTAAGLNYSLTRHGILYVDVFENSTDELKFTSWHVGHAAIELTVEKGRLSIDAKDCGMINVGDQLDIGPENEITINGLRLR
jgi:hypothetical protein